MPAVGVALVGVVATLRIGPADGQDQRPAETGPRAESTVPTADRAVRVEIYREVVAARVRAAVEARRLAPGSDEGLPVAPGSVKGAGKRAGLVALVTERAMRDIAAARGLDIAEVEAIAREGDAKRWPAH